tara:strand:+ start:99 stop:365 length:267 start_codon:yes stop_codon:yes gene_type:complete
MLDYIANGFMHLGWAIWGEACDCKGILTFNRLARFLHKFDEIVWSEDDDDGTRIEVVSHRLGAVRYPIGRSFTLIATWMDDQFDSVEL